MNDPQGLREIDQTLSPNAGVPRQQVEDALQKLLAVIGGNEPFSIGLTLTFCSNTVLS